MDRLTKPPSVKLEILSFIESFVRGLFGLTSSHSTAIAELEARLATGASFSDNFNRANAPVLGIGWIQGGAGQGLGIIDYAARLDNTALVPAIGIRYAICPQAMTSNDQVVSAIVNPAGVMDGCPTALFVRANAGLTEFVYANVWKTKIYLGRGTRSGNTWTFSDWKSADRGVSEADTVELVASGTTYQVNINGANVLEYTDTSGYPVDSSHRTIGFSSETRFQGIIPNYSWGLAGFAARSSGLGTLAATTSVATAAQTTAVAAQATAESKPGYSDIPTDIPLWQNINASDDPTFPLSQIVTWTQVYGSSSSVSAAETTDPSYVPATRVLEVGHIRATRDRTYNTVGMITGNGGWGFEPQSFTVYVFKMDPATGVLTKVWNSGDVKSQIAAAGTQFRITMPTITAKQGDVFAVGVHQISPSVGTSNRPLMCVHQAKPAQPIGVFPRNIYGWVAAADTVPDLIPASSLQLGDWIPWFVLG